MVYTVLDDLIFSKIRNYRETVKWFETHTFSDNLSPYIREYLKTGRLDSRYYNFDDELRRIIGDGNGFYPSDCRKGQYYDDWKNVIMTYRKNLINNLKSGKDYHTKKGTIRIVQIVYEDKSLKLHYKPFHPHGFVWAKDAGFDISPIILILEDFLKYQKNIEKRYGKLGFTL